MSDPRGVTSTPGGRSPAPTNPGNPLRVGVRSEVGRLREVMVHRPGLEVDRITPGNASGLLFDDVMWAERAREEHDVFVEVLESHGVRVHLFEDLLAGALSDARGREFAIHRVCSDERFGPPLAQELTLLFADADASSLASYLIGGVLKSDLAPLSVSSLTWSHLDIDDFVLEPLPNTLFQRDNTAWFGSSTTVNPMTGPVRTRESLNTRTVYRHHPLFAQADFEIVHGDQDASRSLTTAEGGDIHVIDDGVLMIGMGKRTAAVGVEFLAGKLFGAGQAHTVLAVELPRTRSVVHLDTVLTMIDVATFVAYPHFDLLRSRIWRLAPGEDGTRITVEGRHGVRETLEETLGREVRIHESAEDPREGQREPRNEAESLLALAPGVVIGYERNVTTNRMLGDRGVEVLAIPGSELGRGRGSGTRRLSCPIFRESL